MHRSSGVDRTIAGIAAQQRGLVTRQQLVAAGVGRGAIGNRLKRGQLHAVHRGVYLVGHAIPLPLALELAAALACGTGAAVSHRSAAALWSLLPAQDGGVEVTAPVRGRGHRPGIRVRHDPALGRDDFVVRDRVPVTTPARTLVDLGASSTPRELERALAEAWARRLITRERLRVALERYAGRRGAATLRGLVGRQDGPSLTRSEAEELLLGLVRRAQLPNPRANALVGRYEVDMLWRSEGLAVEVEGYAYHSSPRAFERDRRRDAELAAAGLRLLRVTWRQIVDEPEAVVARITRALVSRPDLRA